MTSTINNGITTSRLDHDPWLFNCLGGTVNLKTGMLQAHRHEDYLTKIAHIEFDPDAKCPLFDKFIHRIMGGDNDLTSYMQRFVGYCLTGSVIEQVLLIFYGTGANGKSVLSSILGYVLGDYANAAGGHLLLHQPSGGSDLTTLAELAKLRGARLARISEIDEGARLAEAQLKNITGGDTITCRTLFGKPFEYEPSFKVILLCNHMPQVRGTDYAIWRRIHKVPFSVTIPPEERDPNLIVKLRAELPGILNWAIAGCLEWQKQGLNPPAVVQEATAEYQTSEDMFASWLKDSCNQGGHYSAKAKDLLESFKAYSGWKNISHKKFGGMLTEYGFEKSKSDGVVWHGLEPSEPLTPFSDKSYGNNFVSNLPKNASDGSNGSKGSKYKDDL